MKTVWVLTSEYNAYDQYGEYFIHAWHEKPSATQLAKVLKTKEDIVRDNDYLHFLLNGGGREQLEYVWYNLQEHEC